MINVQSSRGLLSAGFFFVSPIAAAAPDIEITAPLHGAILNGLTAPHSTDIAVSGTMSGLDPSKSYTVTILNSCPACLTHTSTPLGSTTGSFLGGRRFDPPRIWTPGGAWVHDWQLFRPVVAELYEGGSLVARDRIVILDNRVYNLFKPITTRSAGDSILGEMQHRLTEKGLSELDDLLPSLIEVDGVWSYDQQLDVVIGGGLDIGYPNLSDEFCFSWSDAPSSLQSAMASEKTDMMIDAGIIYALSIALYPLAIAGLDGGLLAQLEIAGFETMLILPTESQIDFCVTDIDGLLVDAEVGAIDSVTLVPARHALEATPELIGITGDVDIQLDMYMTYRNGKYADMGYFSDYVDDIEALLGSIDIPGDIEDVNVPLSASRCSGRYTSTEANGNITPISVNGGGEDLDAQSLGMASFSIPSASLNLGGDDICSIPEVADVLDGEDGHVEIKPYATSAVEQVLGVVWNTGSPTNTRLIAAIEAVLSPFEIGLREDISDETDLYAYFSFVTVGSPTDPDPHPLAGLTMKQDTSTSTITSVGASTHANNWVYVEPTMPDSIGIKMEELTWNHNDFSFSYQVTTGHLNQMLQAAASGPLLNFDSAPINRSDLELALPDLSIATSDTLFLRFSPTLAPSVTMDRNATSFPSANAYLNIGHFIVQIIEDDPISGEIVWATLSVDNFYNGFDIFLDTADGHIKPVVQWGAGEIMVMEHNFPIWPNESFLSNLWTGHFDELKSALHDSLTQLPAPEWDDLPWIGGPQYSLLPAETTYRSEDVFLMPTNLSAAP